MSVSNLTPALSIQSHFRFPSPFGEGGPRPDEVERGNENQFKIQLSCHRLLAIPHQ